MNCLKRILLAGIKRCPAVSRWEICDKIQPYVARFNLRLSGNQILFPEKISMAQFEAQQKGCVKIYDRGIPYKSIVHIEKNSEGTTFYLSTGHVFIFSSCKPVWTVSNVREYSDYRLLLDDKQEPEKRIRKILKKLAL